MLRSNAVCYCHSTDGEAHVSHAATRLCIHNMVVYSPSYTRNRYKMCSLSVCSVSKRPEQNTPQTHKPGPVCILSLVCISLCVFFFVCVSSIIYCSLFSLMALLFLYGPQCLCVCVCCSAGALVCNTIHLVTCAEHPLGLDSTLGSPHIHTRKHINIYRATHIRHGTLNCDQTTTTTAYHYHHQASGSTAPAPSATPESSLAPERTPHHNHTNTHSIDTLFVAVNCAVPHSRILSGDRATDRFERRRIYLSTTLCRDHRSAHTKPVPHNTESSRREVDTRELCVTYYQCNENDSRVCCGWRVWSACVCCGVCCALRPWIKKPRKRPQRHKKDHQSNSVLFCALCHSVRQTTWPAVLRQRPPNTRNVILYYIVVHSIV